MRASKKSVSMGKADVSRIQFSNTYIFHKTTHIKDNNIGNAFIVLLDYLKKKADKNPYLIYDKYPALLDDMLHLKAVIFVLKKTGSEYYVKRR